MMLTYTSSGRGGGERGRSHMAAGFQEGAGLDLLVILSVPS